MPGSDLPIKELGLVLIAIVFAMVLFMVFMGWLKPFGDLNMASVSSGPVFYSPKDIKAIQSVEALVCAINTVGQNSPYQSSACDKYWSKGSPARLQSASPASGFVTWPGAEQESADAGKSGDQTPMFNIGRGKTLCNRITYYYYCADSCYIGDTLVEKLSTEEECEKRKIELTTEEYIKRERSAGISCSLRTAGEYAGKYQCVVKNFSLPQETPSFPESVGWLGHGVDFWNEWIGYLGDPQYLIYWQNFPMEEDTWNFQVSWSTYAWIAAISLIPWGKVIKYAGKEVLLKVVAKVAPNAGEAAVRTVINKWIKLRFWSTISLSGAGKKSTIQRFMKRALSKVSKQQASELGVANSLIKNGKIYSSIKNFIGSVDDDMVQKAFQTTESQLAVRGSLDLANPEKYIEKYSRNLVENIFSQAGEGTTAAMGRFNQPFRNAMIKDINENFFEIVARESIKDGWTNWLLSKKTFKQIPGYIAGVAGKAATLTGAAWALELADSIVKAREDKYPNSIVVKKPMSEPYVFQLSEKTQGKPIFVNLVNVEDYVIGPQVFDAQTQFYLASPCYLKSLDVSSVFATCENFQYATAGADNENSKEYSTCNGKVSIEYSQKEPRCDARTYRIDASGLDAGNADFVEWVQSLESIPGELGFIYDSEKSAYNIPVDKGVYARYVDGSDSTSFIRGKDADDETWNKYAWQSDTKQVERRAETLPESKDKAIEAIGNSLLECFDKMQQDFVGNCVIYNTNNYKGDTITEAEVSDWLLKITDAGKHEKVVDMLGEGVINQKNMEWVTGSIGAGNPRFFRIYPDYTLVNEVTLEAISNSAILEIKGTGSSGTVKRDIEITKSSMGINTIRIKLPPVELLPSKFYGPGATPSAPVVKNIVIELSDMGDDGMLRYISVSDGKLQKSMLNTNAEADDNINDMFEKFGMKNCHTAGVLIEPKIKDWEGKEFNYCTRGESVSGALTEYAGDLASVGAIAASLIIGCTGGAVATAGVSCAGAVSFALAATSVLEITTEAFTSVGGWPQQTWKQETWYITDGSSSGSGSNPYAAGSGGNWAPIANQ
ncbi:MAG: hypothetical protein FJY76_02230 [Candidatus Aenigmarchaeota archaeon]|nr:hypothetical protein [Candidatus Aenigmarchaeota archaeon]